MRTLTELFSLRSRSALVTGAAGHIGRVIAQTLAELGADLILVDRPDANYDQFVDSLRRSCDVHISLIECDLESEAARQNLLDSVRTQTERLDVLVNNAAFVGTSNLQGWATGFEEQTIATWRRAMEVNVTAAFDLSKGLFGLLKKGACGSIINIASIYASHAPDYSLYEGTSLGNPAAGAVSKGALVQLTRWLATTVAPDIRVNAVSPGGIFRNQPEAFVKRYVARTPLGRMATEDDLRGVIAFLATDASQYITGQDLMVDGGWSVW